MVMSNTKKQWYQQQKNPKTYSAIKKLNFARKKFWSKLLKELWKIKDKPGKPRIKKGPTKYFVYHSAITLHMSWYNGYCETYSTLDVLNTAKIGIGFVTAPVSVNTKYCSSQPIINFIVGLRYSWLWSTHLYVCNAGWSAFNQIVIL